MGPRSDFSKPCQGAAEKSVNTTRQAVRSTASNQPSGLLLSPRFPTPRNCFGCGANGDAIDLTAKLFDLNPRQAAEKLAHDFGLDPDKPPANAIAMPPPKRGLTDEQWADIAYCLRVLTD